MHPGRLACIPWYVLVDLEDHKAGSESRLMRSTLAKNAIDHRLIKRSLEEVDADASRAQSALFRLLHGVLIRLILPHAVPTSHESREAPTTIHSRDRVVNNVAHCRLRRQGGKCRLLSHPARLNLLKELPSNPLARALL